MYQHQPKRRKKRPIHGVKTVDVSRGKSGYGFTISGQHPCVLSCIVNNSPADRAGLRPGDYLVTVNGLDVSKSGHDEVVRMVGLSTGTLTLQVAENYNSSDSSEDEYPHRTKSKYPNRVRARSAKYGEKMEKILSDINQRDRYCPDGHSHDPTARPLHKQEVPRSHTSRPRLHMPVGAENPENHAEPKAQQDSLVNGGFKVPFQKSASSSNIPTAPSLPTHVRVEPKQAFIKSTSQGRVKPTGATSQPSRVSGSHIYSNFSPGSLQQIINHSLHSYSAANEAFIVNEDEFEEDELAVEDLRLQQAGQVIRVVVGYIGSLEMPGDANQPHVRIQSIRNAVRRLRVEQKIHTLVLMTVSEEGVSLTNLTGAHVAHYSVDRLAFSGVCPDDRRFFGIVTLHSSGSDEVTDTIGQDEATSSSCHVFMVDQEITAHNTHSQKAKSFGINCTFDPHTQRCLEFPRSTTPIIVSITNLYKDRPGGTVENEVARSQVFANPNPDRPAERSSSNSSNSDSGLGLGREDNSVERVAALPDVAPPLPERDRDRSHQQLPTIQWSGNTIHLTDGPVRHLSPDVPVIPTPHHRKTKNLLASPQDPNRSHLDTSTSSDEQFRTTDKLNVRAMPDPRHARRSSGDGLENQHTAENLRMSMQKLLQARQKHAVPEQTSSDTESRGSRSETMLSATSQQERPVSAPYGLLSGEGDSKKVEMVDLADKLSPRAYLSSAFTPVGSSSSAFKKVRSRPLINTLRSPSAPPIPSYHGDDEASDDDPEMQALIERFERDRCLGGVQTGSEPRRTGLVGKQRDQDRKASAPDVSPSVSNSTDKWSKPKAGSLRQKANRRQNPLSLSHESLVVLDQDPVSQKLTSASSVNSIISQVAKTVEQEEVGRVASWAVNFDKLLKDGAGNAVFTDFLKKEFSEENVEFWQACEEFKRINDAAFRKSKAKEICNKYVSVRASNAVNIDSVARKQVEGSLENPTQQTFDIAQNQIFQLMRQDSYSRFLKSDLYKTHLMAEMEGRPLVVPGYTDELSNKNDKLPEKEGKKKGGKGKENEEKDKDKRRRSLLPWRQKSSKNNVKASTDGEAKKAKTSKEKEKEKEKDGEVNNNTQKKGSSSPPIVVVENVRKENRVELPDTIIEEPEQPKFCRVIMPDGSTTLVGTGPGQTSNYVLGKLCEKRNLSIASVDVFLLGSDKPLNLSEDISVLGGKEVTVERRVLFRMDLPNKKSIGVKAKPNRVIRDVFRPILNKYGFRIDSIDVHLAGQGELFDLDNLVSTIDSQRVVVSTRPVDDTPAMDGHGFYGNYITSTRLPLPNKHTTSYQGNQCSMGHSLEEITNQIFGDLMQGKSETAHNFDELGILDPDKTPKGQKGDDPHSSGFFGLLRRESVGVKDPGKTKARQKVTFALQKNQVRSRPNDEEEKLYERLKLAQSQSLDDQRGPAPRSLALPEFLVQRASEEGEPSIPMSGRASAPTGGRRHVDQSRLPRHSDSLITEIDDYIANVNEKFAVYTRGTNAERLSAARDEGSDLRPVHTLETFGSPSDKLPSSDQSFSEDGVLPSHQDADDLFQVSGRHSPDFDDPCMTDKSLTDIGFNYGYNKYLAKSRNFINCRQRTSPQNPALVQLDPASGALERSPVTVVAGGDIMDLSDSLDTTLTHTPRSSPSLSDSSLDKENLGKYVTRPGAQNVQRTSRHTLIHSPITTPEGGTFLSTVDIDGKLMLSSTPKPSDHSVSNAGSTPKILGTLHSMSSRNSGAHEANLSQADTSITFV